VCQGQGASDGILPIGYASGFQAHAALAPFVFTLRSQRTSRQQVLSRQCTC
jgi:hypothetical protein